MRTTTFKQTGTLGSTAAALALLTAVPACNQHPLVSTKTHHYLAGDTTVDLEVDRRVDILFVIDDSGSMAQEQAKLAANFAPFIETLDEAGADYRIAVTTSDNGGYGCLSVPESGRFVATSCLDRPDDFVWKGEDVHDEACAANCSLTTEELGITGGPWIESSNGASNLAPGVSPLSAFQCVAPQGVAGCGFEEQLESMALALHRSEAEGSEELGFLRPGANLLVVIVTDEADCSYVKDHELALFSVNGETRFFEPGVDKATSAVCWNAGVSCTGDPSGYDSCRPVDLDVNGAPTSEPGEAVLHPVDRYVDLLAEFAVKGDREVLVSVIAGVPQGYAEGLAELIYAEAEDLDTAQNFGIGHGCESGSGEDLQVAIPPVRLADFAEAFAGERRNLHSVCSNDYTPALQSIVDELVAEFRPACFEQCAIDFDELTPGVQPNCRIIEERSEDDRVTLPACELEGEAFVLPDEADACWILRADAEGFTPITADDLHEECKVEGQNLEFELVRRPGIPVAGGTRVLAQCEVSAFPSLDCPDFE